jgi:hypothetical protein
MIEVVKRKVTRMQKAIIDICSCYHRLLPGTQQQQMLPMSMTLQK